MELTKQVCSLELAKRLKELRVKQDGRFFWHIPCSKNEEIRLIGMVELTEGEPDCGCKYISAFTVAELGEMLPTHFKEYFMVAMKINTKNIHNWQIGYQRKEFPTMLHVSEAENEADARAKMLIYLLENNLIKNA